MAGDSFASKWEFMYWLLVRNDGLPDPERQYPAIPGRRFRFDFAWPDFRVLVEVQGGLWIRGRHLRAPGYTCDREKMALAQLEGWTVLEFTAGQIQDGAALRLTRLALGLPGERREARNG